jgi:NAD(P)-dependent dehydrogenase (short-subunit alcohol dehydrogenase family)
MTVAVVTGGAVGIGAAIAEELGRQDVFVVTVDPGVAVDGTLPSGDAGAAVSTAQRIVDAGGQARASNISVTDEAAIHDLFTGLVDEFGAIDAVVNVAGISRPTAFASGAEADWRAVLDVHLNGYLNVLRAALPIMAAAGHGRILGVTSGSGWRAADAGAYSCAKRAVAALTWQIGRAAPGGVSVNALSPIAATRMVTSALARQADEGNRTGKSAASGGVALGALPPPEVLGPVGAYLAGEEFSSWARGQIMFSNGAELAWVVPGQLLEVARTADVASLPHLLAALGPAALAPAEGAQATNGGGIPRVGTAFADAASDAEAAAHASRCVIVTDVPAWGDELAGALAAHGTECVGLGAWPGTAPGPGQPATTFDDAGAQLAGVGGRSGPIDAVVVALAGNEPVPASADVPGWQRVVDEHAGITDLIGTDAAWVRAVSDLAAATERPIRVVTVVDATTAGGRSRAQAAAQLARAAHGATADRVDAFVIGVESAEASALRTAASLVAHLTGADDAGSLSGAELVTDADWFGLRSHPSPAGTLSFGGPAIPGWLDGALQAIATGSSHP